MNIKKGDTVVVITGKDKGKSGKVLEVFVKENRVLVDGINIVSRHTKPKSAQEKGGIIKKAAPINASNVMIMCSCGKATRVAHKIIDGKKVRICKVCGMSLDKEHSKAVKKDAKKVNKTKEETTVVEKEAVKKQPAKKAETKKETVKKETKTDTKKATTVKKTVAKSEK